MKGRISRWLIMIAAVSLAGCGKGEKQREPSTPQEMYARVRELLKPSTPNTPPDPQQAMRWLHRAAENGFLRAQTDLGGIYLQGGKYGIAADGKEALKWFTAASNQGSKEALYYIGLIYKRGQDVPRDGQKALSFWRQAAKAGVADASLALGAELVQRPESIQEGIEWLKKTVATREAIPASTAAAGTKSPPMEATPVPSSFMLSFSCKASKRRKILMRGCVTCASPPDKTTLLLSPCSSNFYARDNLPGKTSRRPLPGRKGLRKGTSPEGLNRKHFFLFS